PACRAGRGPNTILTALPARCYTSPAVGALLTVSKRNWRANETVKLAYSPAIVRIRISHAPVLRSTAPPGAAWTARPLACREDEWTAGTLRTPAGPWLKGMPMPAIIPPQFNELAVPPRLLLGPGPANVAPRVQAAAIAPLLGHLDPVYLGVMNDIQAGL